MSTIPPKENELVVQNTELEPVDSKDERSIWYRLLDTLRTTIGLKPLYLAERWTTARIRNEEVNADTTLLAARAQFELAAAEAHRIQLEAEGRFQKDTAIAEYIRRTNSNDDDVSALVQGLLEAASRSPDDCATDLLSVIERIQLLGGTVEIEHHKSEDKQSPK